MAVYGKIVILNQPGEVVISDSNIIYPVGIAIVYDEKGNVKQTKDFDNVLAFSIKKVKNYLSSRSIDINKCRIDGTKGNWNIFYRTNKQEDGISQLILDGINGNVLSESHNIQFTE